MTRGKKGASAAKGRAEAAEQRLAEMKAKYDEEKAGWTTERADLRNEAQQLRNRLVSEVAKLAKDRVREAEERCALTVKEEREKWTERAVEALRFIDDHVRSMKQDDLIELSRLLGAGPFQGFGYTRDLRRLTPRQAKADETVLKSVERGTSKTMRAWSAADPR